MLVLNLIKVITGAAGGPILAEPLVHNVPDICTTLPHGVRFVGGCINIISM